MTYKDYAEEIEAFASGTDPLAGTRETEDGGDAAQSPDAEGRIGRVVSVEGSQAIVLLEAPGDPGSREQANALQIGAMVKMRTPETMVFGMVCGLSIPIPSQSSEDREMRIVELELVGDPHLPVFR